MLYYSRFFWATFFYIIWPPWIFNRGLSNPQWTRNSQNASLCTTQSETETESGFLNISDIVTHFYRKKNADILGTTFCFNKDVRLHIRNNTGLIRKVDHIGVQLAVVPSSIGVQECLGPKSQSCMYCFTTLYYTTYFSLFSDPFW